VYVGQTILLSTVGIYLFFFSLNLRIILISYHKRSGRWNRIDVPKKKKKKWGKKKEQGPRKDRSSCVLAGGFSFRLIFSFFHPHRERPKLEEKLEFYHHQVSFQNRRKDKWKETRKIEEKS
jgi:hypothetical protein